MIFFFCCLLETVCNPAETSCFAKQSAGVVRQIYYSVCCISLFLFFFCFIRVSSVFIFTVVKRKLKLAADVEADFFLNSKSNLDTTLLCWSKFENFEFAARKRQIFPLRTTAKIRH